MLNTDFTPGTGGDSLRRFGTRLWKAISNCCVSVPVMASAESGQPRYENSLAIEPSCTRRWMSVASPCQTSAVTSSQAVARVR